MPENTVLDNNVSSIIKFKDENGNDYPKWIIKRLGDLFDIFVGGDIDKTHSSKHQTKKYCYPVFANALIDDGLYGYADYYKNIGNTITVTGRGDVGHAVARHCAYVPIVRLLVLVPKHKECVDFFAYQINVTKIFIESTGVPQLTSPQLSKVKIKCPCIEEQEKIASFLTSIDNLISIQEERISTFETYNRGLISKVFSQEIRFKNDNGNDYPDWKEKTLIEVCDFINGKAHENAIEENGAYIVVNSKFISSNGTIKKYSNVQITPLYKNDIVMVMSDVPNGKAIAKCYLIDCDNKYTLNQRICALRTSQNPNFIKMQINRNPYYLKFDDGVKQTNLRKEDVLKCPLLLPCLEEQEKIANFLTSLDNVLQEEKNYLEYLKIIKKGLLQQMFV